MSDRSNATAMPYHLLYIIFSLFELLFYQIFSFAVKYFLCMCNQDIGQKIFNKNFTRPGFQILQPFYMIETVKKRKNKNT